MNNASALVLAAGSLGDSLLTLPALRALQSQHQVTVAGTPPYQALGAQLLGVSEVGPLDSLLQTLLYAGPLKEEDRRFLEGFKEVYVFFKEKDGALLEKLTSIGGLRVHFPPKPFRDFLLEGRWAADYWLQTVLDPLPSDCPWRQARLQLDEALRDRGRVILERLGLSSPLVIHPGSGSPEKNAPLSFFRTAAEKAVVESGRQVLVVWGEAEEKNLPAIRQAFAGLKGAGVLPAMLTLRDLTAVLSHSAAYLGNDSGVTQLAAACGLRTFAVFNNTDARVWGPQQAVILAAMQGLYK